MNILAIDIGGTGLKAAVISENGAMLTERLRVETPHPAVPEKVVDMLVELVAPLTGYEAVAVGFPGVVRGLKVVTGPNLGNDLWTGFDLGGALEKRLGRPVKLANDADMQGLAAIVGQGVEMVITLGTGYGSALFHDGRLAPHLELSMTIFRKNETYNQQLGDVTRKKIGNKKWNRRVKKAIAAMRVLTNFDFLYIGGGNARRIDFELPEDVKIVPNSLGMSGGAWLWHERKPAVAETPAPEATPQSPEPSAESEFNSVPQAQFDAPAEVIPQDATHLTETTSTAHGQ